MTSTAIPITCQPDIEKRFSISEPYFYGKIVLPIQMPYLYKPAKVHFFARICGKIKKNFVRYAWGHIFQVFLGFEICLFGSILL